MDKPAIRVHHGPGGASSFSLGGNYGYEEEQPKNNHSVNNKQLQSSFSLGGYEEEQQTSKNESVSETSETGSYIQPRTHETGVSDSRRFIKVHHAPGGASNFSLGGDYGYEEEKPQKKTDYNTSSFSLGNQEEKEEVKEVKPYAYKSFGEQEDTVSETNESGSYIQPRTHETGVSDSRRFIKVHHAPGGASNFSLGGDYTDYSAKKSYSNENNSSVSNDAYDPYATSSGSMSKNQNLYNNEETEQKKQHQSDTSSNWWSHEEKETVEFVGGSKKFVSNMAKQEESKPQEVLREGSNNNIHTSVKTSNPPGGRSSISFW
eukprot:TRINITY_DN194_c0_g1_i1.p1 TRINITY_DN194_c0_g1~~TRINITY_DN194_c0_g1_i1.p1  ORF type:complete len:318 (+),score=133.97 TRINITY_DN194_c0_g1_i1:788-1741(+)